MVHEGSLDEKDLKILDIVQENSKLSTQQISKKTGIPITTVHNRLKKMERDGVITKFTVQVNRKMLGIKITAFILVTIDFEALHGANKDQRYLFKELAKMHDIESVNSLAGQIDLIVKVNVADMEGLNNFILNKLRTVVGIDKTQTLIVLENVK